MHKLIMTNKLALIALTSSLLFVSACTEKRITHSDTNVETNAIELSLVKDYQKDCSTSDSGHDCTNQNKQLTESIDLQVQPQPALELETKTEPTSSDKLIVPNYFPTMQSIQL